MKSRSRTLLDKSLGAVLSAMEIYNKPDFYYREETFSILMVNAWELLLKARLLQLSNNKMASIVKYEKRQNADGSTSEKLYRSYSRSGNVKTVSLFVAYDLIINEYGDKLDNLVRKNLEALIEIRDNSVHFLNKEFELKRKIFEIGTASLKNYLNLVIKWFGIDLSKYNFFLMPMAFIRDFHKAKVVSLTLQEKKLIKFVENLQSKVEDDETKDFNLALEVSVHLKRASSTTTTNTITISNDPNAPVVRISEEDIREKYPWDYAVLTTRLKKRYQSFKCNQDYHGIRKPLESDERYCNTRLLDPGNPSSSKKIFYNPNILKEFDKHYNKS